MELQLDYGETGLPAAFLLIDQVVEDPVQHKFHRLYNRSYTPYSARAFSLVKDYEAMSPGDSCILPFMYRGHARIGWLWWRAQEKGDRHIDA